RSSHAGQRSKAPPPALPLLRRGRNRTCGFCSVPATAQGEEPNMRLLLRSCCCAGGTEHAASAPFLPLRRARSRTHCFCPLPCNAGEGWGGIALCLTLPRPPLVRPRKPIVQPRSLAAPSPIGQTSAHVPSALNPLAVVSRGNPVAAGDRACRRSRLALRHGAQPDPLQHQP